SGTAAFVAANAAVQGSWHGSFGYDGYQLAGDSSSYPGYAQVSAGAPASFVWAAASSDPRALETAATPATRLAASWYGSSLTTDVNLTDGKSHLVALYFLDFDGAGRSEQISVCDSATGAVLDTRTVASFGGGQYLTWLLTGHVQFRLTGLAGPNV